MKNQQKIQRLENDLESHVRHFYKTENSVMRGILAGNIIQGAREYYELTGRFYRRVWNGQMSYKREKAKNLKRCSS